MAPQLVDRIRPYGERADAAAKALREQHGFNPDRIEILRDRVNTEIDRIHGEVMAAGGGRPTFETWDAVEYSDADSVADIFIAAEGITDATIAQGVRHFVQQHAALKLQLEIEDMRDMEDISDLSTWSPDDVEEED